MTHQEAVSALRAYADGYAGNIRGMCAEAADMLEELEQRVPRWISVEERLPEENEQVICWYEIIILRKLERWLTVGSWDGHGEWWLDTDPEHDCEERVTHWMPLPEPPEEDEHGKEEL